MKYFVTSYLEVEGLHCWPGVLQTECTEKYLASPHRHVFKIRATIPVTHTDRDVEFIEMAHNIKAFLKESNTVLNSGIVNFESKSCERIAMDILDRFENVIRVEITEDGESGATIEK